MFEVRSLELLESAECLRAHVAAIIERTAKRIAESRVRMIRVRDNSYPMGRPSSASPHRQSPDLAFAASDRTIVIRSSPEKAPS